MRAPASTARQDVAAEFVETERMRGRRTGEAQRQLLRGRIERREERAHDRRRDATSTMSTDAEHDLAASCGSKRSVSTRTRKATTLLHRYSYLRAPSWPRSVRNPLELHDCHSYRMRGSSRP